MNKLKKLLPQIGLYLGTFLVLNVAMYFFLQMTQPKSAVMALHGADSLAVAHEDSLAHDGLAVDHAETSGGTDSTAHAVDSSATHEMAQISDSMTHDREVTQDPAAEDAVHADPLASDDVTADTPVEESPANLAANEPPVVNETPQSTAEISKLAKMLEGMKPTEAAVIVEGLPTETIVQLVMRMKSRNGAKMMASLPVPVAASVASRMAEISGTKNPS